MWTALILLCLGALGTFFWVIVGACAIAYLSVFPPRRRLKRTPASFGADFENVAFPSRDGVTLSGWYLPPRDASMGTVILCHGMSANRTEMLPWAAALWKHGFALLMFDFRRLGESGGERCTAGYFETRDIQGAADYASSRPACAGRPLGVFGFSMGGATAIMAAADDPRLRAVAAHGAYATLDGAIRQRCRHHFGPFAPLAQRILMAYGYRKRLFVASTAVVTPVSAVPRLTPRPLLLLHGERDPIVPTAHAHDLYFAARGFAALHLLPRSRHKRINRSIRAEAREKVVHFFCEHLA